MKAADLFDLRGEVALVTGASSGLGRRFARVLAANGARVACLARRRDRLESLAAEIAAAGGQAIALAADVADHAAVEAAFAEAERGLGTVTILVNNAGIVGIGSAVDQAEEDWSRVIDVNLKAAFSAARSAARRMIAAGRPGAIVNMASILGLAVQDQVSAYAASKAALIQLTRALALELAPRGIRVNALAPGYFASEMTGPYLASEAGKAMIRQVPLGRIGAEGDLDGALLLLASNAVSFMTGATVVVDGGHVVGLRN